MNFSNIGIFILNENYDFLLFLDIYLFFINDNFILIFFNVFKFLVNCCFCCWLKYVDVFVINISKIMGSVFLFNWWNV